MYLQFFSLARGPLRPIPLLPVSIQACASNSLARLLHIFAAPPPGDPLSTFEAMHTLLSTRLTRAALKAARPARRHVMRALRHHATRTRALAGQWRDAKPVDGIRMWFQTFFSALRTQAGSRRFSLRTLLRKPTPLRALPAPRVIAPRAASRRPRRMSFGNEGWFGFASP
jgi:hypothetical protein